MDSVFIKGLSYYVPKGRIANEEIINVFRQKNKGVFGNKEFDDVLYGIMRKLEFLGVETRSSCSNSEGSVEMSLKVANDAIYDANISKNDIDCIIFSAVSNPFREPTYANLIGSQLEINNCDYFDINDTCNGFLKSIEIASLYINNKKYNNVLIVTSENPYEISDKIENALRINNEIEVDSVFSYMFLGTGAAAFVLSNNGKSKRIKNYEQLKNINNWDSTLFINPFIKIPENRFGSKNSGLWADGRCISSTIIKDMPDFIKEKLDKWKITEDKIDHVVIHQLGDNIIFATLNSLGINKEKLSVNTFKEFGNMACANIPVNLCIAKEKGLLKLKDRIMLFSSSCGISYAMAEIIW